MPANRVFLGYRIITHKVITMKTNLKAVRKAAGLTQEKASELSGVPLGTLRRWEQGVNEPDMESIIQLASLYGVTTDTLLGSKCEKLYLKMSIRVDAERSKCLSVKLFTEKEGN